MADGPLRATLKFMTLVPALLVVMTVQSAVGIWFFPARADTRCGGQTLLVMGAAQYNGVPSPAFERRLDKALELYREGCGERVIVTGGRRQGDVYTEGRTGLTYLQAHGVPKAALQCETRSENSYENLKFSKPLIAGEEVVIVTDDLHAYRSLWLARRLGIEATVATAETHAGRIHYALRELVALMAYRLGLAP